MIMYLLLVSLALCMFPYGCVFCMPRDSPCGSRNLCHNFRHRFDKTAFRFGAIATEKKSSAAVLRGGYTGLDGFHLPPLKSKFVTATVVNGLAALLLTIKGQKSLTSAGLLHSMALGIGLWTFLDIRGWTVGVSFLVVGSLATKLKIREKEVSHPVLVMGKCYVNIDTQSLGIAEKRGGARAPGNVWGSAATGMICAVGCQFLPVWSETFKVAFVASFSAKLGDTLSSEIGKAYGKTTYLITSWKKVPRGTEGAVSLEGTIAGIVGAVFMALLARWLHLLNSWNGVIAAAAAATCATTVESFIGAIFQDSITWLSNEVVNFIMTLIGAGLAMFFHRLLSGIQWLS